MIKRFLTVLMLSFLFWARVSAMSLNVQEGDLHSTVLLIAEMGGLNVSVDDSVKGLITISIDGVEPRDALDIVAMTKDLHIIETNGVLIITSKYGENVQMDSYVFTLKYADPDSLREVIVKSLNLQKTDDDTNEIRTVRNQDGSKEEYNLRGNKTRPRDIDERVVIDKDTNSIILYGTQREYERVRKILDELDVPLKQISIEAKILAINKEASKDIGIDWYWSSIPQYPEYHPSESRTSNNVTTTQGDYYTRNQNELTGYGVLQFGHVPETSLPYEWYFGARLNALITDGKARMLSKPNIMTVQGHEATINVGNRVPVPTREVTDSGTTTSYEYRDAGIILRVTPRVNADGSITSLIHTEVSTPYYVADVGAYRFTTRSADTTVTMQDGRPLVIGGLIGRDEERSIRKIPFLGDLPILGALFKSVRRSKSDSELVIFLTAHVIDPS